MAAFSLRMKKIFSDIFLALGYWFQSWSFISRNGLFHFFLYPILISILLSMGAVVAIRACVDFLMAYITPHIAHENLQADDVWSKISLALSDIAKYAIALVIGILSYYLFSKFRKYIVLALMAPVMALLSAQTYTILSGRTDAFSLKQFVRDTFRGIVISFRNLLVELLIVIIIWGADLYLTIFAPPLGLLLSPVFLLLSFFVSCYFFGFSAMDYGNERNQLSIRESIATIRKNRGIAIGNGIAFSLLFRIPFVGTSFAIVTSVVGGTLAMHEKEKRVLADQ